MCGTADVVLVWARYIVVCVAARPVVRPSGCIVAGYAQVCGSVGSLCMPDGIKYNGESGVTPALVNDVSR